MRTEDILGAIVTTLTGLTTTGGNVQREQDYDIEQADLPRIIITQGEDVVQNNLAQSYIDWQLTVDIDLLARGNKDDVVTVLNTMRGEIHAALMLDYQLGLGNIVKFIEAIRVERPIVDAGDRTIIRQTLSYSISYRTNWANLT